jgi:hypothetical protein
MPQSARIRVPCPGRLPPGHLLPSTSPNPSNRVGGLISGVLPGRLDRRRHHVVGAAHRIGGEGMVVKPVGVIHRGPKGLARPGIKVRGREYLRIIYGPGYTPNAICPDSARGGSDIIGRRPFVSSLWVLKHSNGPRPGAPSIGCTSGFRRASPGERARWPPA